VCSKILGLVLGILIKADTVVDFRNLTTYWVGRNKKCHGEKEECLRG
jgi:hypothetical protein